jgi:hypothetical protein
LEKLKKKQKALGRVWCDVPSITFLAGLGVILHKPKFVLFLSRALREVSAGPIEITMLC